MLANRPITLIELNIIFFFNNSGKIITCNESLKKNSYFQ